jgi:molybdopterin biosynthesis enzyme MoaB
MPGIDESKQFIPLHIAVLTVSDTRSVEDDKSGATYIFCLPGSPGACRDAWDDILVHQLDYRYRPCNFVEIMPRLDEHLRRAKAQGATV